MPTRTKDHPESPGPADLKARMFARVVGDGESIGRACALHMVEMLMLSERAGRAALQRGVLRCIVFPTIL